VEGARLCLVCRDSTACLRCSGPADLGSSIDYLDTRALSPPDPLTIFQFRPLLKGLPIAPAAAFDAAAGVGISGLVARADIVPLGPPRAILPGMSR